MTTSKHTFPWLALRALLLWVVAMMRDKLNSGLEKAEHDLWSELHRAAKIVLGAVDKYRKQ